MKGPTHSLTLANKLSHHHRHSQARGVYLTALCWTRLDWTRLDTRSLTKATLDLSESEFETLGCNIVIIIIIVAMIIVTAGWPACLLGVITGPRALRCALAPVIVIADGAQPRRARWRRQRGPLASVAIWDDYYHCVRMVARPLSPVAVASRVT